MSMQLLNDNELVKLYMNGNEESLSVLVKRHKLALENIALSQSSYISYKVNLTGFIFNYVKIYSLFDTFYTISYFYTSNLSLNEY